MPESDSFFSRLGINSLDDIPQYQMYLLALLVLLVLPSITQPSQVSLLTTMIILGMFAMAFDFLYGYSGVVSFGHAMFFGLGSYIVAIILSATSFTNLWAVLVLALVLPGIFALVIGWISIQAQGVFFAILTLAWAQVTYILVRNGEITGGSNGLSLDLPTFVVLPGIIEFSPYDAIPFYYFTLLLLTVTFLLFYRLAKSPFGAILKGIRENPERMNYLGYNERRYRIAAFTISGAVSGLTGALHAMQLSFASPSNLYFLLSGEVIIWTIVGGAGTLVGPIVGAGLIHYIEHVFSSQIVWWNIPVGIFFILVVIFMPEGLAGGIKRLKEHGFFED